MIPTVLFSWSLNLNPRLRAEKNLEHPASVNLRPDAGGDLHALTRGQGKGNRSKEIISSGAGSGPGRKPDSFINMYYVFLRRIRESISPICLKLFKTDFMKFRNSLHNFLLSLSYFYVTVRYCLSVLQSKKIRRLNCGTFTSLSYSYGIFYFIFYSFFIRNFDIFIFITII